MIDDSEDIEEREVECGFVLYGDIEDLEDIKKYIIEGYAHVTLIRSIYTKESLILVEKSGLGRFIYNYDEKKLHKKLDNVYFAFLLHGKEKFIKKIEEHINQSSVELCLCIYSKDRMSIVKKSLWNDYKNVKEEEYKGSEDYKKKYKIFLTVKDEEEDNEG